MSLITRNNYEAYLLDYVEENLSPELVAELMLFLEQNSDLKEDLDGFDIHELVPLDEKLMDKSILKKEAGLITLANYEDFMIAEIEGLNNESTSAALHLFLAKNTDKQKEFAVYQQTKLVAPSVIFKNKQLLKKKMGVIIPMYFWYSSAAAVIVVLFLLNGFNNVEQTYLPIADREEILLPNDNGSDSSILKGIEIQEKQLAVNDENSNNSEKKEPIRRKKTKKKSSSLSPPYKDESFENEKEFEDLNGLANNQDKQKGDVTDTSSIETPQPKNEIIAEEDLYANVQITYEEEVLDNGTPTPVKQKITKLEMVRMLAKKRVDRNLAKGKGVLMAINAKPLDFIRRKNKN